MTVGSHPDDGDAENGSTLILTAFFAGLALLVVLIVVCVTSLYVERTRLFTIADGAALAGAESFTLDSVTVTGGEVRPRLDPERVAEAVTAHLAAVARTDATPIQVVRAGTIDAQTAQVTLRTIWHPPLPVALIPDGIPVEVTVVARAVFS